jgi:ABC-2 type transport system permease protein
VFAAFNVLLVRAVFAWIDRWLVQRKTREILVVVFMVLFASLLVTNSVLNQKRFEGPGRRRQETAPLREALARYAPLLNAASVAQQWLPPGLSARMIQRASEQEPAAAVASLGVLGLWVVLAASALAARLKAQYRGQNLSWAPGRGKPVGRRIGWTLGGSRPFSAIVEKELRSLMRTVPLLWAMIVPLLFVLVIAGMFHHGPSSGTKSFPYALPLCVAYALLGFTGLFYNNLGAEGAGIQLLFVSPTPIRTVLLAKNLLYSILFVLVGLTAGVLSCLRLGVPPLAVLAATYAWLVFALSCNLIAGTVLSLTTPYRIHPGRITRSPGSQANTLPALLIQLAVLGAGLLVFWLCWSSRNPWLPVPILLALAAGAFFVWMRVLHYSDDNANRRKDVLIATLMKTE